MTDYEMWKEAMEGVRSWEKYQEGQALKYLFHKKSFCDELKEMRWYERWFYWLKTLLCLKLGRLNGSYLNNAINTHCWDNECNETQDGTYYSWWSCWVEMGVFKNWRVKVARDGT